MFICKSLLLSVQHCRRLLMFAMLSAFVAWTTSILVSSKTWVVYEVGCIRASSVSPCKQISDSWSNVLYRPVTSPVMLSWTIRTECVDFFLFFLFVLYWSPVLCDGTLGRCSSHSPTAWLEVGITPEQSTSNTHCPNLGHFLKSLAPPRFKPVSYCTKVGYLNQLSYKVATGQTSFSRYLISELNVQNCCVCTSINVSYLLFSTSLSWAMICISENSCPKLIHSSCLFIFWWPLCFLLYTTYRAFRNSYYANILKIQGCFLSVPCISLYLIHFVGILFFLFNIWN